MVEVSTSILTVEPEGAIQKFYNLETAHTDYFHIDVMDAKFVEKDTSKMMLEYAQTIKQISHFSLRSGKRKKRVNGMHRANQARKHKGGNLH